MTLINSNDEDLSPHTSQTIYFPNMIENKKPDKEIAHDDATKSLLNQNKALILYW